LKQLALKLPLLDTRRTADDNTIQYNTIQYTTQHNTIQYNTIQYKTCNAPYVTRKLFLGEGMTRD